MSFSVEERIRKDLFALQDLAYQTFHSKLIPTVDAKYVIGVRTPALRKYAKKLSKTFDASAFMNCLPHKFYEENNLHGFLIETITEYNTVIEALDVFLPYVDNWATCDMIAPKIFKEHLSELYEKIKEWIVSDNVYTVRFAIGMLLKYYLDNAFVKEHLDLVAAVSSNEYYINMMIAWYFATALAKQYDATIPFITENRLSLWNHNKTIQKAIESYRITPEQKEYLKTLRRK